MDSSFSFDDDKNNCIARRSRNTKVVYVARKSTIIDLKGNTKELTASTQDWINEILGVVDYDKREKSNKYSWPDTD